MCYSEIKGIFPHGKRAYAHVRAGTDSALVEGGGANGGWEAMLYFILQNPFRTVITAFQKVGVSWEEATEAFNKFAELHPPMLSVVRDHEIHTDSEKLEKWRWMSAKIGCLKKRNKASRVRRKRWWEDDCQ